jgi:hypothetical protein
MFRALLINLLLLVPPISIKLSFSASPDRKLKCNQHAHQSPSEPIRAQSYICIYRSCAPHLELGLVTFSLFVLQDLTVKLLPHRLVAFRKSDFGSRS